jgi:hypothetical protein
MTSEELQAHLDYVVKKRKRALERLASGTLGKEDSTAHAT